MLKSSMQTCVGSFHDDHSVIRQDFDLHSFLLILALQILLKFMFSKKATQTDEIFTVDLTLTTYC